MSIIIFSSDSMDLEKDIAEKTADAMKYKRVDRQILTDIASKYQLSEAKLQEALEKTPSFFRKMPQKLWQQCLSCIESEVLEQLLEDNIVCWDLAAHLYVLGVSHALKVRLLAGYDSLIDKLVNEKGFSRQRAQKWLKDQSRQREKWSNAAYERDETDPSLYDLVINLEQIDPEEAVKTITGAVAYRKFQPMTYSIKCLTNLSLASKVTVELLKSMTDIRVKARDGTVVVTTKALKRQKRNKAAAIKEIAGNIEGVNYVEVHVITDIFGEAAGSSR